MDNKQLAKLLALTILLLPGCKELESLKSLVTSQKTENNNISVSAHSPDKQNNSESKDTQQTKNASPQNNNNGDPLKNKDADVGQNGKTDKDDTVQPKLETPPILPVIPELVTIAEFKQLVLKEKIVQPNTSSFAVNLNNTKNYESLFWASENNYTTSSLALTPMLGIVMEGVSPQSHDNILAAFEVIAGYRAGSSEWNQSIADYLKSDKFNFSLKSQGQLGYFFKTDYLNTIQNHYGFDISEYKFIIDPDFYLDTTQEEPQSTQDASNTLVAMPVTNYFGYLSYENKPDLNKQKTRIKHRIETNIQSPWQSDLSVTEFLGIFEKLDGQQTWSSMLKLEGELYSFRTEDYEVVEIPLEDNTFSFIRIEPTPNSEILINTRKHLESIIDTFKNEKELNNNSVFLPTFTLSGSHSVFSLPELESLSDLRNPDFADFSSINGRGYLYLQSLSGQDTLTINGTGMAFSAESESVIRATDYEPVDLFSGNYINQNSGYFSGVTIRSIGDASYCINTYVKEREADAYPFVYAMIENETGTIVSVGQLLVAEGEEAGQWICEYPTFEIPEPDPLVLDAELPPTEAPIITIPDLIHEPIPPYETTTTP